MASPEPFISSVELWPLSWAPVNWAICAGQLLPIQNYTALFSLIGTTYGGNGQTNFGLPNLQGRVPIGAGQGPGSSYQLGETGGAESVTLTLNNMPLHTHPATGTVNPLANNGRPNQGSPENNFIAPITGQNMFSDSSNCNMAQSPVAVAVQPVGGNLPFANMQPYLALNYIIALQGIYPSRP